MDPETMQTLANPALETLGIQGDFLISPLPGSALKRTFRLHHEGLDYALKWYPPCDPHEADPFVTEQCFYQYLKQAEVHQQPFALAWDAERRVAILSLLHGRGIREDEVNLPRTVEAAKFLCAVNAQRSLPEAAELPGLPSRERSLSDMLEALNTFLLGGVPEELHDVHPLMSFWEEEVTTGWQQIIQHTLSACDLGGLDPATPLNEAHAVVSPGEFSFHNTLLTTEHSICFCDFDQARWADPACLVARFFAQADFNAKAEYLEPFLEALDPMPDRDPIMAIRIRLLAPLIRMESVLNTLFPMMDWELGQCRADANQEGKVQLVQNIWQARQHLKAGLHAIQ